ncbi:MAG: hypothetical protein M0R03_00650 [Novosphingobium sp.]|nr:hypothetical protein [Novosphingobium sp.]
MQRLDLFRRAAFSSLAALALAAPAAAQDGDERVNQLIVYGEDPCPASAEGEITVCARKPEAERYRIPEALRSSSSAQNDAWNNKVLAYETVGKTGAQSCTPVGPGGWTGCASQLIGRAYAEKDSDPSIRFADLIAAERAKRLSTIDEDAAAMQARVEQAEKEIEARERARQEAAGQDTPPPGH